METMPDAQAPTVLLAQRIFALASGLAGGETAAQAAALLAEITGNGAQAQAQRSRARS